MNKLYKCALGLLTTFILTCCCFSSADDVEDLITKVCSNGGSSCDYSFITTTNGNYQAVFSNGVSGKTYCIKLYDYTPGDYQMKLAFASSITQNPYTVFPYWQDWNNSYICIKGNTYLLLQNPGTSTSIKGDIFELDNLLATSLPHLTSLECQTEYNLIPISEITTNYCKLNFDLISPSECPIQPSGSGAVNWSSLFINGTQYPGNASISVYIPEYIGYSITYNDDENLIDIEGYNADTDYIEGVINNEKLTPTNEDITLLFTGLVNFIPYLFIGLLIIRAVKIFSRIWR